MIGTKARWMTGALVSAGLLLGSVGAAEARPRYGYDRGWDRGGNQGWDRGGWDRRHRRGNGFGLGDAIGVAALVGAVAVVASSMSKDRKVRDPNTGGEYDAPPSRSGTDYGTDYGADVRDVPPARDDADFSDMAAQDDRMSDTCAVAARDEAQDRNGGYAEVRHMETPIATADGYNIDGYVESRSSYRANDGVSRRFTCAMKNGRVADVYISRDVAVR